MSRCLNDCVALIGGDGWTANNDPFVLNDRHNRLHLSGAVCVLPSFFSGFSFFFWFVSRSLSLSLSLYRVAPSYGYGRHPWFVVGWRFVSCRAGRRRLAQRDVDGVWRRCRNLPSFTEFCHLFPIQIPSV